MFSSQLKQHVVVPVLRSLEPEIPYSEEAVDLLLMTCAHESNMGEYIHQIKGPAQGIYQMEPNTEQDIWENFLGASARRAPLSMKVNELIGVFPDELIGNLYYATAMARVHYWRVPEALPKKSSSPVYYEELAKYAKKYFNTYLGKATWEDYYNAYMRKVQ